MSVKCKWVINRTSKKFNVFIQHFWVCFFSLIHYDLWIASVLIGSSRCWKPIELRKFTYMYICYSWMTLKSFIMTINYLKKNMLCKRSFLPLIQCNIILIMKQFCLIRQNIFVMNSVLTRKKKIFLLILNNFEMGTKGTPIIWIELHISN